MKVYVIRHGETQANRDGVFQGQTDCPLLESGVRLALKTGEALKGIRFGAAFSSPLTRARRTAELVLGGSGNDVVTVTTDDRLLEISMGDYEGLRFRPDECEIDRDLSRRFFENPFKFGGFPNGEDTYDVCTRTQDFLNELAHSSYSCVLVSTHGFALRAMLNGLYENPDDFWQGHVPYNCAVSIVEVNGSRAELTQMDGIYYDERYLVDRYAKF